MEVGRHFEPPLTLSLAGSSRRKRSGYTPNRMALATMAPAEYCKRQQEQNRRVRQFLHALLAGGPQPSQVVYEQAVAHSISQSALMTAKSALHIRSTRAKKRHLWARRDTSQAASLASLNVSPCVTRQISRRRDRFPLRCRAHRLHRRRPLRGLLVSMATIVDLRHTARHCASQTTPRSSYRGGLTCR